jgi:capsid protein
LCCRADSEARELTATERQQVADLVEGAKTAKSVEDFSLQLGAAASDSTGGGPGDVFIKSQGYKAIRASDLRPQQWSSGPVEVISPTGMQAKGTLLESGAGGPGGGLVPPMYQPGVVSKLFEPLGVADVFGQSTTTASQVRYAIEGTATNAAGGVAEGAAKPESTLAYSEVVEPAKKVATWLPVSDEMLEDAPSMQSYLNQRLSLFVRVEEERQLLRGAGTNELVGIFGRSGINQYTKAPGDDNATALAEVVANTFCSSFLYPTAIFSPKSKTLADVTALATGELRLPLAVDDETVEGRSIESVLNRVKPWDDTGSGAALADEVQSTIQRHIVLTEEQAVAATLWIFFSWVFDSARVAPYSLRYSATTDSQERPCPSGLISASSRRFASRAAVRSAWVAK